MSVAGWVNGKFTEAKDARDAQDDIREKAYYNTLGKYSPGVQGTISPNSEQEEQRLFIRIIPRNFKVLSAKMGSVIDTIEISASVRDADVEQYRNDPEIREACYNRQNLFRKWMDMGDFSDEARKISDSAIWSGNGIMRCPVIKTHSTVKYEPVGELYPNVMKQVRVDEEYPAAQHVSVWNFYIDPAATCVKDAAYVIQTHKIQPCYFRYTAKELGWDMDAVSELLQNSSYERVQEDDVESTIQEAKTGRSVDDDERIFVLDYWGGMKVSDLKLYDVDIDLSAAEEYGKLSDGDYVEVNVVTCGDKVLKAVLNPFYPVPVKPFYDVKWDVNPESPYGAGMPEGIQDQQQAINGFVYLFQRGKLYASANMFETEFGILAPGQDYDIHPGKVWVKKAGMGDAPAIKPILLPDNSNNLLNAISLFSSLGEEVSGVSRMDQGTGAPTNVTTATGQSILQNNSNEVSAAYAKRFDAMVEFMLEMFDWYYMTSYKTDEPKIPLKISASAIRSTQAKEIESQKILNMMQTFPVFAQAFPEVVQRVDVLSLLRRYAENMELPNFVRTDEELAEEETPTLTPEQMAAAFNEIGADPELANEFFAQLERMGIRPGMALGTQGAGDEELGE